MIDPFTVMAVFLLSIIVVFVMVLAVAAVIILPIYIVAKGLEEEKLWMVVVGLILALLLWL